jgi:hypothetical protein
MYLSILILPLLASFVSGFMGRKIGVTGSHFITCTCLILASVLATFAFYEVGICGSPVSISLVSWIDSEIMSISWEFLFDQLTVSMFIPVLYISTLIHIYTTDYLSSDPHNQRFFSYLSLFTFFMLLLVSGGNYFVMFIGWEGKLNCLKWCIDYNLNLDINYINSVDMYLFSSLSVINKNFRSFFSDSVLRFNNGNSNIKINSSKRIGPHNLDIISIIVGSTLSDTHLEKRNNGIGTRIIFEKSNKNVEYLMWFHSYLSSRGYCNSKKPILHKRIRKNGEIFFHYRVNSYTFSSFNWIHDMFYIFDEVDNNYVKIIPNNIEEYLTPLALAIWFMDDGSKLGKGARIATNCFTEKEIIFLCEVLYKKYNITVTAIRGGKGKGHILYIHTNSMNIFTKIIKPYMLPSLYYKLGNY